MRRLAPFGLVGLIALALPGLGPFDLPLRGLLIFPALGLFARWFETNPGEPHEP